MIRTAFLFSLMCCSLTAAQEFCVETQVFDVSDQEGVADQLLCSSITVFHKGKVYDFVESADEVTIYEPNARRFTILNTARGLVTTVTFQEIEQLLKARHRESLQYIQELQRSGREDADRVAASLSFQLDPVFETNFERASGRLELSSDQWTYRVGTHAWEDSEQVKQYLDYTDMLSRLNFVLHPSSFFPEPRMALNEELRATGRMPTSVQMDLRPQEPLTRRADHKFVTELSPMDLNVVRIWESAARSGDLRELPFRRYQETILVAQNR